MFRNYVIRNFPFLEDDFDALTDYQLFCKMCGYVIKYSKDNKEMREQIEEFKHYFDTLDVQEEINNKLDEMASDGTLDEIINQHIFDDLNTEIENNKVYSLADNVQAKLYKDLSNLLDDGYSCSGMIIKEVNNVPKGIAVANDWTEGGSGGEKFIIVSFDFVGGNVTNITTRSPLLDGHSNSVCDVGDNKVLICANGYNYIYDLSTNGYTLVTSTLPYFSMVTNDGDDIYACDTYDYTNHVVMNRLYKLNVDTTNNTITVDSYQTVPNLYDKIQGNEQGMVIYNGLLIFPSFSNCKLCIYELSTLNYLKTQLFTAPYIVEYEDGFIYDNKLLICDTLGRLFEPDIYGKNVIGGYDTNDITKSLTDICLLDDPIKISHGGSKSIDFKKYMTFMNYDDGDSGIIGKQLESITIYGAIRNFSSSGGVHNLTPIEIAMYKNITVTGETISWYAKGWSTSWEEYSSTNTSYSKYMVSGTFDFGGGDTNPTIEISVADRLAIINIASDGTLTGNLTSENDFEFYITKIIGHRKVGMNI